MYVNNEPFLNICLPNFVFYIWYIRVFFFAHENVHVTKSYFVHYSHALSLFFSLFQRSFVLLLFWLKHYSKQINTCDIRLTKETIYMLTYSIHIHFISIEEEEKKSLGLLIAYSY